MAPGAPGKILILCTSVVCRQVILFKSKAFRPAFQTLHKKIECNISHHLCFSSQTPAFLQTNF